MTELANWPTCLLPLLALFAKHYLPTSAYEQRHTYGLVMEHELQDAVQVSVVLHTSLEFKGGQKPNLLEPVWF
jgi:hypothetical protein